jgi:flagellar FliL protein
MADRITEPRSARPEASATEAPASPTAPAAKKGFLRSPWFPLAITVIAMPALAFATTRFVLLPQMTRALTHSASTPQEPAKASKDSKGEGEAVLRSKYTVPLSKILVNVAGTMGTRYLMTSITLVSADPDLKAKIDENRDQLMDLATSALCTKTISDLEKPGARNVIRSELVTIFNNALGSPLISEIYITEMAIQ